MKTIYTLLFTVLSFCSFAANAIDPPALIKVIVGLGTDFEMNYNIGGNGFIESIQTNSSSSYTFTYDANGNVISVQRLFPTATFTFTYDANNRITSVNAMPVAFNVSTQTYTLDYALTDPNEYLDYTEFKMNDQMLLMEEKNFYFSVEGNYSDVGTTAGYASGNLTGYYDGSSPSSLNYENVGVINPLKAAMLPALRALCLVEFGQPSRKLMDAFYYSQDIISGLEYSLEDPESFQFLYQLKPNGQVWKRTDKFFYLGALESVTSNFVIYYYEGDTIPD